MTLTDASKSLISLATKFQFVVAVNQKDEWNLANIITATLVE